GHFDHGWLDTRHTFSFGEYHDARHMGFRSLRVINEDRVQPGEGFGTHGHRDMEIISYVLEGGLAHRDSMGNGSVLRPGDVQRMSAGTGVRHSEYNASDTEPVHFLQIWIEPAQRNVAPSYEEAHFDAAAKRGQLRLVASGFNKIGGYAGVAGYIGSKGLPMPQVLAALTIVLELGGGILLVLGWKTRWLALLFFLWLIPTTFIFHRFWGIDAAQVQSQ